MIKLDFNITQRSWVRPEIEPYEDKPMINSLRADFMEDIIAGFKLKHVKDIKESTGKTYPVDDIVGLTVSVKSSEHLILLKVIKNVMDALNERAYKDDRQVESVYAQFERGSTEEVVVRMHVNTAIDDTDTFKKASERPAYMELNVDTLPCDEFIYVPKNPAAVLKDNEENQFNQNIIRNEVVKQYSGSRLSGDVAMSVKVCCRSKQGQEPDIDNIALNYMYALQGTVIDEVRQIKELYISIDRSKPDRAEVTIRELNPPVMHDFQI